MKLSEKISWVLLFLFIILVAMPAQSQMTSITLDWVAPGDDGNTGVATSYDMRWSANKPDTTSISSFNTWWSTANIVSGLPAPLIAGTTQSTTISPSGGFTSGKTYYFVIRTSDEVGNISGYSNVAWKYISDTTPPGTIFGLKCR